MIVFAVNVHTGGGKVLLDALLEDQPFGPITAVYTDARYSVPASVKNIKVFSYRPTILERIKAQFNMKKFIDDHNLAGEEILFFGNYPPFITFKNKSIVYLQNCFLLSGVPLPKDSIKEAGRNLVERLILKFFKKNINELWVQTDWMVNLSNKNFKNLKVLKKPFLPTFPTQNLNIKKEFDFICVSDESLHKNLNLLTETLNELDGKLSKKIKILFITPSIKKEFLINFKNKIHKNLEVKFETSVSRSQLFELYQRSKCLIVASSFESFCLPIYEAKHFGLEIVANDIPVLNELKSINLFIDFRNTASAANYLKDKIETDHDN